MIVITQRQVEAAFKAGRAAYQDDTMAGLSRDHVRIMLAAAAQVGPEPVATTSVGARVDGEPGESVVRELERVGTRIDGLIDVVMHSETRLTDQMTALNDQLIVIRAATPTTTWLQEQFDALGIHIDRLADAFGTDPSETLTRSAAEEYGKREYDRGVAAGRASREHDTENCQMLRTQAEQRGFDNGVAIGRAQRESELLDAGWTPPGAVEADIRVDAAYERGLKIGGLRFGDGPEVSTAPTDYEVWRDALIMAVTRNGIEGGRTEIQEDADFFRDQLKNYPTDIPELDPADQAIEMRAAANPRDLEDPPGMDDYL